MKFKRMLLCLSRLVTCTGIVCAEDEIDADEKMILSEDQVIVWSGNKRILCRLGIKMIVILNVTMMILTIMSLKLINIKTKKIIIMHKIGTVHNNVCKNESSFSS